MPAASRIPHVNRWGGNLARRRASIVVSWAAGMGDGGVECMDCGMGYLWNTQMEDAMSVIRFKLIDNASEKKQEFYDFATKKKTYGPSPYDIQMRFLKALHEDGFVPFDFKDGWQYWKRP